MSRVYGSQRFEAAEIRYRSSRKMVELFMSENRSGGRLIRGTRWLTQRAATVFKSKIKTFFKREKRTVLRYRHTAKRTLITDHGIQDRQHFSHASRDGYFFLLASFHQLVILGFDGRVVSDR